MSGRVNVTALSRLLMDLVSIPSVNPRGPAGPGEGEARVARFVAGYLGGLGLNVAVGEVAPGRPNVVCRIPGRRPGPGLLLEAHMDTVEADGMTVSPWGEERDGRIYGRGACDTKASLAAMLMAVRTMVASGAAPERELTLAAVADEEYGYLGVKGLVGDGLQVAAAIVGEPTGLVPVVAHKGTLRFRVHAHGRRAHSAAPELGVNAISLMRPVLEVLEREAEALRQVRHPLLSAATLTVTSIRAGIGDNVVPDHCQIGVDCRLIPPTTPLQEWERYRHLIEEMAPGGLEVERSHFVASALATPVEHWLVRGLCRAVERVTGRVVSPAGAPYGTDASVLAEAGIPAVVFGPGDIAEAHTAAESVPIAEVVQAAEVLLDMIAGR